jgi:hypothetical protein
LAPSAESSTVWFRLEPPSCVLVGTLILGDSIIIFAVFCCAVARRARFCLSTYLFSKKSKKFYQSAFRLCFCTPWTSYRVVVMQNCLPCEGSSRKLHAWYVVKLSWLLRKSLPYVKSLWTCTADLIGKSFGKGFETAHWTSFEQESYRSNVATCPYLSVLDPRRGNFPKRLERP